LNESHDSDLLDSLYSVAVEPERFQELVDVWQAYLDQIDMTSYPDLKTDFSLLERHLVRAQALVDMVGETGKTDKQLLIEKLEKESQAMMAVKPDGTIEAANSAGQAVFNLLEGADVTTLPFSKNDINRISSELTKQHDTQEETLSYPSIMRVMRSDDQTPILLSFSTWSNRAKERFTFIKTTDFVWPDYLTPVIAKAFGLTGAEADIVRLIVEGTSVKDIADRRGSRISTVRGQIRTLYAKTSTKNQSEFMRMAVGLTTLQLVEREASINERQDINLKAPISYPRHGQTHQMTLADERCLEYSIFGAADGYPILFFHNEYQGHVWPAKIAEYATARGLKIIIPARPCYGRSDSYPEGCDHLRQTAEDFTELLDTLNIHKAFLMAQTLGGVFASSMLDLFPERVAGYLSMSPLLPHLNEETAKKMPRMHRFIYSVVRKNPALLEFIGRAGNAYYKRVGALSFAHYVLGNCDVDHEILKDPEYQEALIRSMQFSAHHGHKGYVAGYTQIPAYHARFRIENFHNLPFPLHFIIGNKDGNTRFQRAEDLRTSGVDVKVITAEGGGELLIYSHPTLVIDSVCEAIGIV